MAQGGGYFAGGVCEAEAGADRAGDRRRHGEAESWLLAARRGCDVYLRAGYEPAAAGGDSGRQVHRDAGELYVQESDIKQPDRGDVYGRDALFGCAARGLVLQRCALCGRAWAVPRNDAGAVLPERADDARDAGDGSVPAGGKP